MNGLEKIDGVSASQILDILKSEKLQFKLVPSILYDNTPYNLSESEENLLDCAIQTEIRAQPILEKRLGGIKYNIESLSFDRNSPLLDRTRETYTSRFSISSQDEFLITFLISNGKRYGNIRIDENGKLIQRTAVLYILADSAPQKKKATLEPRVPSNWEFLLPNYKI